MPTKYKTREQWLNAFVAASRKHFKRVEAELPETIRVAIGFTSAGARGKRIGECWSDACSKDGAFEIFIVPGLDGSDDASRIADILTHELVHAAVGIKAGHGPAFRKVATALGLEGKMTATTAGAAWHEWADPIVDRLGPLPHATLNPGAETTKKKQTTRLLKCECDDCGFTFRASAKWALETAEELRCPDPGCDGHVSPAI